MDVTQIAIMILAVIGLTVIMLGTRRRIRNSQQRTPRTASEVHVRAQRERQASRDLEQVMLELDELSRQIHGRIDTKLARLDATLRMADVRIEQLTRLTDEGECRPTIEVTLGEQRPETMESAGAARSGETPSPARNEPDRPALAETSARGAGDPQTPAESAEHTTDGTDPRYDAVYRLADEGKSADQIATIVGRPTGEVDLILALRSVRRPSIARAVR